MKKLIKAGVKYEADETGEPPLPRPIIKLFMGNLTWLVTHIESSGVLIGYADLGFGCVEFGGLAHIDELASIKVGIAFLERDRYWKDEKETNYLIKDCLL